MTSEAELAAIAGLWAKMLKNEWISFPVAVTSTHASLRSFVVSDASGTDGWGYRLVTSGWSMIADFMSSWRNTFDNEADRNLHIYYKELHAACEGLKEAKRRSPRTCRFVLGCDNAAS